MRNVSRFRTAKIGDEYSGKTEGQRIGKALDMALCLGLIQALRKVHRYGIVSN